MITETEILSKYRQSLKEARDQCVELGRHADPAIIAPRGWRYTKLKKAVTELEGCCRQMSHWRADARWVRLGIQFGKMLQLIQRMFVGQRWLEFRRLIEVLDLHMRHCEELATGKTGRVERQGAILPSRPSDWIITPNWRMPVRPGIAH